MKGRGAIRLWAVVFWLIVWQILAMLLAREILLPSPVSVLLKLIELGATVGFWQAVGFSCLRIFLGFAVGLVLGILMSALAARFRFVKSLLAPLIAVIKSVPVASFVVLALVWLNSRSLTVFIVFLMVFPICYQNILAGIENSDKKLLEMANVFKVPSHRIMRGIYIPQVLPYFKTAISLGLGLCWKAGTAAEIIGIPQGSLGERLYSAKIYFQTGELFAYTVVIVLLSVIFEKVIMSITNRAVKRVGIL